MNSCLIGLVLFSAQRYKKSMRLSHTLCLMDFFSCIIFYGHTIIAALHEQQYGSPAHNDYAATAPLAKPCHGPHAA